MRGLSQAQLGRLIGVGQARAAEIEAKAASVSAEQLMRVLQALGAELVIRADTSVPVQQVGTSTRKRPPTGTEQQLLASLAKLLGVSPRKLAQAMSEVAGTGLEQGWRDEVVAPAGPTARTGQAAPAQPEPAPLVRPLTPSDPHKGSW
ncbi:hypothetical protein AAW51_0183 [Caldimonas brevitalea]|uniref:HTH cro/C1-type domain-containing protein n=2 Tax=Caldimonas brevitalea TaxID=413882 RepID=A0A0G3BBZ3_9BURK|nr:hypothetical protein AAW51_0183 [Caldimonas brevitalea]